MSLQHPNRTERQALISEACRTVAALESLPILTPCSDCEMFLDGWCRQWKQQVPESAQRDGCAEWVEAIPF